MRRALIIGLGPLVAASPLLAQAQGASAKPPPGRWVVDFAAAQCVASRNYGSDSDPLYLVLKAPPLGEVMQLSVIRKGFSAEPEQVDALIAADDQRPLRSNMLVFSPKGSNRQVYQVNLSTKDFAAVRQARSVSIRSVGLNHRFELSQMEPLMRTIDECVADLRRSWNISEGSKTSLRQEAAGDLASFFNSADYPSVGVTSRPEGTVKFALLIDETGRVADCTVIETSGVASLDGHSCAILKSRAKFSPAVGADGRPARDWLVQRVVWETGP